MRASGRMALSALVIVAMTVGGLALVAGAKVLPNTASVPVEQLVVLAGSTGAPLDVTVNNRGVLPVGTVAITTPSLFTITSAAATGWTVQQTNGQRVVFQGALLPGMSAAFHLVADVGRPAVDGGGPISVSTSSNGGQTLDTANAASTGALDTSVRVLQVVSAAVTAPARAADGTVTEGQANTILTTTVRNAGTAALSVTPSVAVAPGGSPATIGSVGAASVPAGGLASFAAPVTFGTPGTTSFVAGASGTNAQAIEATSAPVIVQAKAAITYASQSLQPRDVVPGNPYSFTLNVANAGAVAVDVDPASSRISFGPGFTAPLASAATLPSGNTTAPLSFAPTVVPTSIPDTSYDPTVTLGGLDANDAPVVLALAANRVSLDRTLPVVLPALSIPPTQVEGTEAAVTNNTKLTFGGTIGDNNKPSCPTCWVTSAAVREIDANGGTIRDRPVTVTNDQGTLTGSTSSLTYNTATRTIRLVVTARDRSGNTATNLSAPVPVDRIRPAIQVIRTGRGIAGYDPDGLTTIVVNLTEAVALPSAATPSDWGVDGHHVTGVSLDGDRITLTLAEPLGADETPSVSYHPLPETQAHDRVGLLLLTQTKKSLDGIFPAPAHLAEVSGQPYDGGFFTNDSTPTLAIDQVVAGNALEVSEHTGSGDTVLTTATIPDSTVTLTLPDLGGTGRDVQLVLATIDGAGNRTVTDYTATPSLVTLDFTAPILTSATASGRSVTVNVSEILRLGRSYAIDWTVNGLDASGQTRTWQVTAAALAPTSDSIILTVDDGAFNPATDHITTASYAYLGSVVDRYRDRAGNELADQTSSVH